MYLKGSEVPQLFFTFTLFLTQIFASEIKVVRIGAKTVVFVQRIQFRHVFSRQFKIKDIRIFFDAMFFHGFWNGDHTMLEVPTQHDLRRRFAVFFASS